MQRVEDHPSFFMLPFTLVKSDKGINNKLGDINDKIYKKPVPLPANQGQQ